MGKGKNFGVGAQEFYCKDQCGQDPSFLILVSYHPEQDTAFPKAGRISLEKLICQCLLHLGIEHSPSS